MRERAIFWIALLACVLFAVTSGNATQLTVATYSMYNGNYGSYNYTDFIYVPCNGVCSTSAAYLTGGTGKLTDGVSPVNSWWNDGYQTEWVGWYPGYVLNPDVTFNFASPVTINSVTVWADNTPGYGDVRLPMTVVIGGTPFAVSPDATWGRAHSPSPG